MQFNAVTKLNSEHKSGLKSRVKYEPLIINNKQRSNSRSSFNDLVINLCQQSGLYDLDVFQFRILLPAVQLVIEP